MDVKSAIFAASGLIGRSEKNQWNNTIRSFEVWWDSQKMELKIVLASQSPEDLENFQTAFRTMYPNASFINMDRIVPVWYSPIAKDTTTDNKYQIFDVSLYHGHYSCRLDLPQNNITITQILNTIQLAKSAWLQFVFAPYNFTPYLRSHTNQLNKRMKYVKSKTYRSFIEKLKEQKPHENPETGFDFYNHYKVLERDSAEKMQNFHVVMSVRGLIDNGSNEDNEDSNYNYNQGLTSLKPLDEIKCDYDHLTTYSYNYSKFYNKKKSKTAGLPIKIAGAKKNFQRIAMFELRLIPSPRKPLENAINHYFSPNMITGNCGTQLAGRISGKDASKLAKIWDPRFSNEITQQLAVQEDFHWTIKMRAADGEEQPTPIQFWLHKPTKLRLNDNELNEFIQNQKKLYGNGKISEGDPDSSFEPEQKEPQINENNTSLLQLSQIEKNRWLRYITVDLPETKQHWQILLILYNETNSLQLTQITERLRAKTRDDVVLILKKMVKDGLLKADESNRNVKYFLSKKAIQNYFTFNPKDVGTADDIPIITKHVVKSYLDMGLFVTTALQKIEKDEDRTDLIAYSYDSDKSISVEIESTSELLSHPEHAIYNMRKWKKMGFDMCHVWSASKKLQ